MKKCITRILLLSLFILCAGQGFSQSKKELQKRKEQLQKEIQFTNKLLSETEKDKKVTVTHLNQLNRKIAAREELVVAMQQEINMINDSIGRQEKQIKELTENLQELKDEYALLIINANKNRSGYDRLMFIFSAHDFNQAFKRLKYLQQYAQYRQRQVEDIEETKVELDRRIKSLEAVRASKEGLLQAQLNERSQLAKEKQKQEKMVGDLQGKERNLKNQLSDKIKAQEKLDKAIQRIIEEEIRKAKEAAAKAGKTSKGFPMTPEAQKLSESFASNKGKLPWPVKEGVITSSFGEHAHPILKGVKVQNNGIDISTAGSAVGRSIFEGVVSGVLVIPGEGKGIMVRHGEYLSVYTYFKDVFVSKGDKISTKQDLGILMDGETKSSSIMHLEIWKNTTKLDPAQWIYK